MHFASMKNGIIFANKNLEKKHDNTHDVIVDYLLVVVCR